MQPLLGRLGVSCAVAVQFKIIFVVHTKHVKHDVRSRFGKAFNGRHLHIRRLVATLKIGLAVTLVPIMNGCAAYLPAFFVFVISPDILSMSM